MRHFDDTVTLTTDLDTVFSLATSIHIRSQKLVGKSETRILARFRS